MKSVLLSDDIEIITIKKGDNMAINYVVAGIIALIREPGGDALDNWDIR